MEYALRLMAKTLRVSVYGGLNPCFNGICSATVPTGKYRILTIGLNPCFNGICSATNGKSNIQKQDGQVSILVLMEYALRQVEIVYTDYQSITERVRLFLYKLPEKTGQNLRVQNYIYYFNVQSKIC